MAFQSHVLLTLALLAFATMNQVISENWSPIKDINDPYVIGIATFAVNEYNNRTGAKLKFEKIIKGDESQEVVGKNYRLTLSANNGSTSNNYVAIVYDKPQDYTRKLTSFEPVHA
ncbi:cysteine proteinase inhibitor [Trifolium repens]|jgi:hypothetical protein|nr:cysteine proteinase inhibitor [Trifolium repens]